MYRNSRVINLIGGVTVRCGMTRVKRYTSVAVTLEPRLLHYSLHYSVTKNALIQRGVNSLVTLLLSIPLIFMIIYIIEE